MIRGLSTLVIVNIEGGYNMTKITYELKEFDEVMVKAGALCVMVKNQVLANTLISTLDDSGKANDNIVGAGICRNVSSDLYTLTIDSVEYKFSNEGIGNYPQSEGYKLLLGIAQVNLSVSGSASKSNNTTITTRGNDGSISTKIDYSKSSDVLIETLNARDEFALSALRELLSHTDDPSEMSNSEMNYYCNAAYRWAANMMAASADARGSFTQENSGSSSSSTTTRADVPSNTLISDTDKLLNNILNTLERTDNIDASSGSAVYSKRVKVQFTELIDALNKIIANIDKVTTSIDNLTRAVASINTKQDFSGIINAINGISIVVNVPSSGTGGTATDGKENTGNS